ncbi:hypothetical protein Tco_1388816 [Tanacetum coccineum]
MRAAPKVSLEEEVVAMGPRLSKRRRKRGNDGANANAPPKMLRKDHSTSRPTQSILGGKYLASMGVEPVSTSSAPPPQETPANVSDPDPLSYAKPRSIPKRDIAQPYIPFVINADLPRKRPSWEIQILRSLLPSPLSPIPPGYFSEFRHLPNDEFLSQYNINLARQVAMGSQLRLRFEQEVRLRKRATEKIAKREQRIHAREEEIKKLDQEIKSLRAVDSEVQGLRNQTSNLKTLLEAEADMKKVAEAKNAELSKELESLHTQFLDLQVDNNQLYQQVSDLQAQVTGEEKKKAAFEEFKKYKDERVSSQCAEMDARLDALSIDFDEELYPHMLTAIVGRRWVIGHGLRLAVMKCAESTEIRQAFANVVSAGLAKGMSEGLKYGLEHGKAGRDLADIEAYDPEANNKLVKALQDLKELKYPMIDQLEKLKDAPMELIMTSLHLESDTRENAPQWIRDLRPSL